MLKGTATIQLINDATGEIEYEKVENNIITKACEKMFNNGNITDYSIYTDNPENYIKTYTPIFEKLINGLMIFSDSIPDDANVNNIIPSAQVLNSFKAFAAGEYNGTDSYRGTLNKQESGLKNENTYRYVFDFGKNVSNGIIKSLALTSGKPYFKTTDEALAETDKFNIIQPFGTDLNLRAVDDGKQTYYNNIVNLLPHYKYANLGDFIWTFDFNQYFFIRKGEQNGSEGYFITKLSSSYALSLFTKVSGGRNDIYLEDCIKGQRKENEEFYGNFDKEEVFIPVAKKYGEGNIQDTIFLINNKIGHINPCQYYFSNNELHITVQDIALIQDDVNNLIPFNELKITDIYTGTIGGFNTSNLIATYSEGKIYLTPSDAGTKLYIIDTKTNNLSNIDIPSNTNGYKMIRLNDLVVLVPFDISNTIKALYIDEVNSTYNIMYLYSSSECMINNICTGVDTFIPEEYRYDYAGQKLFLSAVNRKDGDRNGCLSLQVFTPYLASINNITQVNKSSNQKMKVIYELEYI